MKRLATLLFGIGVFLSATGLHAADQRFDGETFIQQFASNTPEIRLVEYVRANETLKNWTKLVAIRNFTKLSEPKSAAVGLGQTVKQHNPNAQFQVLVKDDGPEAQIDFLTWPKDGNYMEFNIFRYVKAERYPGLISYQFAYRFTDLSAQAMETFKSDRRRWIAEMFKTKFDIDFKN